VRSNITADVLIIGAGAGGAAVAGALAAGRRRVTILDAGPSRDSWPCGHVRNIDPTEDGLAAFAKRLDEFLVWPSLADSAPPGLAGAKIAHGVGGMFGLWTCNCPWPHPDELPPWDDHATWDAYIRRAHSLLNVQDDLVPAAYAKPNCLAAWLRDRPPLSTAATTRSRRSTEYGLPIHAGLLPASMVNQKTADLGIPNRFNLNSSRSSGLTANT
jgi:choline dehydrogenase-like flavoprotein